MKKSVQNVINPGSGKCSVDQGFETTTDSGVSDAGKAEEDDCRLVEIALAEVRRQSEQSVMVCALVVCGRNLSGDPQLLLFWGSPFCR